LFVLTGKKGKQDRYTDRKSQMMKNGRRRTGNLGQESKTANGRKKFEMVEHNTIELGSRNFTDPQ
jgi:hypothetical protein